MLSRYYYLLAFLVIFSGCSSTHVRRTTITNQGPLLMEINGSRQAVDCVLIKQEGPRHGPGVVLLTSSGDIARMISLFENNTKTLNHLCGYDCSIWFRYGTNQYLTIYYNDECEMFSRCTQEIHSLLHSYLVQMKDHPVSFMIHASVDASISPQAAYEVFSRASYYAFFETPTNERYCYVVLVGRARAGKPYSIYPAARADEPYYPAYEALDNTLHELPPPDTASFFFLKGCIRQEGGEQVAYAYKVLYYKNACDASKIKLSSSSVRIAAMGSADTYTVSLVSPHPYNAACSRKLERAISFVKDVREYSDREVRVEPCKDNVLVRSQ
jgi:hypothetical protein